jgi:hypothetical protein
MVTIHQFQTLGQKQIAIQEGIDMLSQIQSAQSQDRALASLWGNIAVMANVIIIPLNVVINACELKKASIIYQKIVQIVVKTVYDKYAKSGTRSTGPVKDLLSNLKKLVAEELKARAMVDYIPAVNIIVGLAEDSWAAIQTAQMVEGGKSEMALQAINLQKRINDAKQQLIQIGIKRAEFLDVNRNSFQMIRRTA